MNETIGTKLCSVATPIIPLFFLGEAQTDDYPYAVYDLTTTPFFTKDGIYKFSGECAIHLYSKDFDALDTIAESLKAAIDTDMNNTTYRATMRSQNKDCVEGVWDIELNYNFIQK